MQTELNFDLVINGGGLAGLTLAAALVALAKQHKQNLIKIAIIEPQPIDLAADYHPSFDNRAIALAYHSVQCFKQWQIWPLIEPYAHPIKQIEVSEQSSAGFSYIHPDNQYKFLGYVAEAQALGAGLKKYLKDADISWFCPNKIAEMQQQTSHVELTLDDGQKLKTKLITSCDGANSPLRQKLNLPVEQSDYQQVAVTTNVQLSRPSESIAYERFTQTGPLAMLPMSTEKYGLVWCLTAEKAQEMLAASDAEFIAALQQKFGFRAGKIEQIGKRASYPLISLVMPQLHHHRVIFLANASHTLHPVAGQGFNLGVRDIVAAAKVIQQASQAQLDIGEYQHWSGYLAQRQQDIQQMTVATDFLVRSFSNTYQPLQLMRNIGLFALENLPVAKRYFANFAMGFRNS